MSLLAKLVMPEYSTLYKRYTELRNAADDREAELTTDIDDLETENEYLKSELARLRIQYDRAKEQLNQKRSEVYKSLSADVQDNAKLKNRIKELEDANQFLVNTINQLPLSTDTMIDEAPSDTQT